MLEIWIKLLISILTFFSLIVLTFVLFKIPLFEHHKEITIMSLLLGVVSFYARFIIETPIFGLIVLSFFVIILMVLKRYPILYSFIVCGTGFLIVSVIDTAISIMSIQLGFADMETIHSLIVHFTLLNIVTSFLVLLIAFLLNTYNIGFSFIIKKFKTNQILKSHNFMWAGIIILSVTTAQFGILNLNFQSLHFYIFLAISIALLSTLGVAYFQNKKSLRDRFGRRF